MNNPSPNYATCQKCGRTLIWAHSIDGAGSYCVTCAEELSRKSGEIERAAQENEP